MTISVASYIPDTVRHGFTYVDAAGIKQVWAALFIKKEDAEANASTAINGKQPGAITKVEFFTLSF